MLQLAPWVVSTERSDGIYLLGPRLRVVRFVCALGDLLRGADRPTVDKLIELGFVRSVTDRPAAEVSSSLPSVHKNGSQLPNGFVVASAGCGMYAARLVELLEFHDLGRRWRLSDADDVFDDSRQCQGRRPVAIFISNHHPHNSFDVATALEHVDVLWLGESPDGIYVGPLLREAKDLDRQIDAIEGWAHSRRLAHLGFETWPLPLGVITDIDRLACVTLRVLDATPDRCFLVDELREVVPWTSALDSPVSANELRDRHGWSFGLLRGLTVAQLGPVYVSACHTPSGGVERLEGNSGKETQAAEAVQRVMGEAIERFSAWQGQELLDTAPDVIRDLKAYSLADFHPYGDDWARFHRNGDSSSIELMTAVDELTGRRVRVPKALVVFPYPSKDFRPSLGVTTGLAAYPTRVGAVVRGLRELLDRDNFYRNFLHMLPAVRLTESAVGAGLEVARAVGPRNDWLVFAYPEQHFGLPMVQAFFHDRVDGVMVRGTGSGLSWQAASRAAILEATQLLYQARKLAPDTVWAGYPAWSAPAVITELRDYLGSQPVDEPPAVAWERDEEQLSALRERFAAVGTPVLVTAFRTPVHGWHVVRVLVPGMTTCQYSSDSAGGRALLNAPWRYGIPG